jgi:phosphate transport system substrate-binding protein
MIPIGKDAFVFFVNKNNPINNITSSQIRAIYSGAITN